MPNGKEQSLRCSRCGSETIRPARYVAFGSMTLWSPPEKPPPVIPTTGRLFRELSHQWVKDEVRILPIGLCEACLPKALKGYLESRIRKAGNFLAVWPVVGAMAFPITFLLWMYAFHFINTTFLGGAMFIVATICTAVAAFGTPYYLWVRSSFSQQLKIMRDGGSLCPVELNRAFTAEAERLLTTGTGKLPRFKSRDDHPEKMKKHLEGLFPHKYERLILGMAETADGVQNRLSDEWKACSQS